MAPTLYELSVPVYIRSLDNLLNVLKKGEEHAKENGYEVDKLVQASLGHGMNVRYARHINESPFPLPIHRETTSAQHRD